MRYDGDQYVNYNQQLTYVMVYTEERQVVLSFKSLDYHEIAPWAWLPPRAL